MLEQIDWLSVSKKLGSILSKGVLHKKASYLIEHSRDPVLVACSAGVDSTCLLLLIYAHFPEVRGRLSMAHYNHNTRGEENQKDAAFVETIADALGLPFLSGLREAGLKFSEADLRSDRLAYLHKVMSDSGAKLLIQGHHKNDVLESLLMRLSRGSGLSGLVAPKAIKHFARLKHIRPLLPIRKTQLEDSLVQAGGKWREDSSNNLDVYFRNRVRQKVIPALEEAAAPYDLIDRAYSSHLLLEETEDALECWLDLLVPDGCAVPVLDLSMLKDKPRALLRMALNRWMFARGVRDNLSARAFDLILDDFFNGKDIHRYSAGDVIIKLSHHVFSVDEQRIKDSSFSFNISLCAGHSISIPEAWEIKAEWVSLDASLCDKIFSGLISPEREVYLNIEDSNLTVRSWQPGDCYKPLGSPGRRKLQDIFIDKKVPIADKSKIPVICSKDGNILWCVGSPIAHRYRLFFNSKKALRLTYLPRT